MYTFGDLIRQHLSRRHGLNQTRLAAGVNVDPAVITRACKGTRPPHRNLVLRIIQWMHDSAILSTRSEADSLLEAAGLVGLRLDIPSEAELLACLADHQTNGAAKQSAHPHTGGADQAHQVLPRSDADVELAAWGNACEEAFQTGALDQLTALLEHPPAHHSNALELFYRGCLAVQQSEYVLAEQHFLTSTRVAHTIGQQELHYRSLVWTAYCHNLLGNDRLAEHLIDSVVKVVPLDSLIYAEASFVRGLIDADYGALQEAYAQLESARDLAILLAQRYLESRCCANLAPISMFLGRMDRAGRMIQRVEQLVQAGGVNPRQLIQVRNTNVCRLRLMGDLEDALQIELPEIAGFDNRHFHGWFALNRAMAAVDADRFDVAEACWQQARDLLKGIEDNHLSSAELHWERAWLWLRQGQLDQAQSSIQAALGLVYSDMDAEHAHALVIAAVIDMARGQTALVGEYLQAASDIFRKADRQICLVGALLHVANYHVQGHRPVIARTTLAEALTLLCRFRLCGSFYWLPSTMIALCCIAIAEDWGNELHAMSTYSLAAGEQPDDHTTYENESHLRDVLGDYATHIAVRRLAQGYWRSFTHLLNDQRVRVQRRVVQILLASQDSEAQAYLHALRIAPNSKIQGRRSRQVGDR